MATKKAAKRLKAVKLEVGQRWQYEDCGTRLDSIIVKLEPGLVYAHDDTAPWNERDFREDHTNLRAVAERQPTEPPKPAPAETVTYYGEVTGVRKGHVEGTATVTVHMRHVEDWPDEITMPVKFAPCLGDVCKVMFSKPEAV